MRAVDRVDVETVRDLGDFAPLTVVGVVDNDVEASLPHRSYCGLVHESVMFWGSCRDADGNLYTFVRRLRNRDTPGLALSSNRFGRPRLEPEPDMLEAFSGRISYAVDGGVWRGEGRRSAGSTSRDLRIVRGDTVEWHDGGLIELAGSIVGDCGMLWHIPGHVFWTSFQYHVTGTILGTPVSGFVIWDNQCLPPGREWIETAGIQPGGEELFWIPINNRYADGSMDCGFVILGLHGLGVGVVVDEHGPLVATSHVTGRMEVDGESFPVAIDVDVEGEPWHWEIDPRGKLPTPPRNPWYLTMEGCSRRVGDERELDVWGSWSESFTDVLTRRGGVG